MTGQKVVFGLHIPKCAGTSILTAAQSILPQRQVYQSTALIENYRQNRNEIYELSNKNSLRFVFGHHVYDEMIKWFDDVYLFTFLRDPIERHVSNFKFLNRLRSDLSLPSMSVDEYLKDDKSMCDFIISRFPAFVDADDDSVPEKAISVLSKFDYVGDLGTLVDFSGVLSQLLGVPVDGFSKENVSAEYVDTDSDELARLIESVNVSDDLELFSRYKANSPGSPNPFINGEAIQWRKDQYMSMDYDYSVHEDKLVNNLLWEYRDHGVLDEFIALIPEKISFLNKFMDKVAPQAEFEKDGDDTGIVQPETDECMDDSRGLIAKVLGSVGIQKK